MDELVFEVTQDGDGGYCAECLTESTSRKAKLGAGPLDNAPDKTGMRPAVTTEKSCGLR